MSFQEKIACCNRRQMEKFKPLLVGDRHLGWIRDDFAHKLQGYHSMIADNKHHFTLASDLSTVHLRTQAIAQLTHDLMAKGVMCPPYGEIYPATAGSRDQLEFLLDRAFTAYFGIRTFGQHLNAYVMKNNQMMMWIARRAKNRDCDPGKLDQLVGGGVPYGITLAGNLYKECQEEAGLGPKQLNQVQWVSTVQCCYENERGLKPETIYCYDLELPGDFQPVGNDGEVDEFILMPIEQVAHIVRDSFQFKLNCNLVIIDFLCRHKLMGSILGQNASLASLGVLWAGSDL